MKIEAYKRTRIKKELLKAKEMLEEIKNAQNFENTVQNKTKKKSLTCVELKKEILDLHDRKEGKNDL